MSWSGQSYLRLLRIALRDTSEGGWQSLRNLRFHHLVESLAHLFFVSLNLTHRRDVSLRDLVVVLHIVLQRLVVVVLHLLARHRALKLVGLIVSFGHCDLVLGV